MAFSRDLNGCRMERFYFAFGSNLCLHQMAQRCPESRYIGTAELPNYRFQINQRGFANVVYSPDDHVEGLIYLLNQTDEERLDRNEGVPIAYRKRTLPVVVFTANIAHVGRTASEVSHRLTFPEPNVSQSNDFADLVDSDDQRIDNANLDTYKENGIQYTKSRQKKVQRAAHPTLELCGDSNVQTKMSCPEMSPYRRTDGQPTEALVYISEKFQKASEPRDEYVDRMNAGIHDARKLGMSDSYIEECLRRFIKYRPPSKQNRVSAQQRQIKDHDLFPRYSKPAKKDLPNIVSRTRRESKILMMSRQPEVKEQPQYTSEGNANVAYYPGQDRGRRERSASRSLTGIIKDRDRSR